MNTNSASSSLSPHENTPQPEPVPAPRKAGRPSTYTPELGDRICEEITNSSKSLRTICAELGISRSLIFRWLRAHDEFRDAYQLAKECQADFLTDELVEIADDSSQDTLRAPNGRIIPNPVGVHRSKLRIEIRKFQARRLEAKKYSTSRPFNSSRQP